MRCKDSVLFFNSKLFDEKMQHPKNRLIFRVKKQSFLGGVIQSMLT
jgi:hypothetical protein